MTGREAGERMSESKTDDGACLSEELHRDLSVIFAGIKAASGLEVLVGPAHAGPISQRPSFMGNVWLEAGEIVVLLAVGNDASDPIKVVMTREGHLCWLWACECAPA